MKGCARKRRSMTLCRDMGSSCWILHSKKAPHRREWFCPHVASYMPIYPSIARSRPIVSYFAIPTHIPGAYVICSGCTSRIALYLIQWHLLWETLLTESCKQTTRVCIIYYGYTRRIQSVYTRLAPYSVISYIMAPTLNRSWWFWAVQSSPVILAISWLYIIL